MAYFTGTDAINHETKIKALLKTYLQEKLTEEPHLTTFAEYGGADVVLLDDEPTEADQSGNPHILISKQKHETENWWKVVDDVLRRGKRHLWTFQAYAIASEFSGAATGINNPVGSDEKLSAALNYIIEAGHSDLAALGLEEIEIMSDLEKIKDEDIHINPYRITITTYTLFN